MKILKFGGTSVSNVECIHNIVSLLHQRVKNESLVIVCSALSGVTDNLFEISYLSAEEKDWNDHFERLYAKHQDLLTKLHLSQALLDDTFSLLKKTIAQPELYENRDFFVAEIAAFGEIFSNQIMTEYLHQQKLSVYFLDARLCIFAEGKPLCAEVDIQRSSQKILNSVDPHKISIVTGFIAANNEGKTVLLGRGGSDYTAAIFGAALEAEAVEIWTDVDGMLSADPRIVPEAHILKTLSYQEALELCHFGAKVIYPPTLIPLIQKNIPIWIKNTLKPRALGTCISALSDIDTQVTGITSLDNLALFLISGAGMMGISGYAARIFCALAESQINIVAISQGSSEYSICFLIASAEKEHAVIALSQTFAREFALGILDPLHCESDISLIAIVGKNMRYQTGVAGKVFQTLGEANINICAIAQGSSEMNITCVLKTSEVKKAVRILHKKFFGKNSYPLFIFGNGGVGQALLRQIDHMKALFPAYPCEVYGIINSRSACLAKTHITEEYRQDTSNWQSYDQQVLMEYISQYASKCICIDVTASQAVTDLYKDFLAQGIHVVTANKKANSAEQAEYDYLHMESNQKAIFTYEANVGAGLPVISTLQSMIAAGDSITKIEGVLSGTLSFLFNNFKPGMSFSQLVHAAQQAGYTEPDPRDDLSGLDVCRKILILARECGFRGDISDIILKPLLSHEALDAETVEDFYHILTREDDIWAERIQNAHTNKQKLCFVARYEFGTLTVGLESLALDHPLASLQGTDNMIVISSDIYKDQPLVIRGPGAGAEVTAQGILIDILGISNKFTPSVITL